VEREDLGLLAYHGDRSATRCTACNAERRGAELIGGAVGITE
jgi:hypothetical protein